MRNTCRLNINKALKITLTSILGWMLATSNTAYAQSEEPQWWFNVEFIAFERDLLPTNNEDFSQADFIFTPARAVDLISIQNLRVNHQQQTLERLLTACEIPPKTYLTSSPDASLYTLDPTDTISKPNPLVNAIAEAFNAVENKTSIKSPSLTCLTNPLHISGNLAHEPLTSIAPKIFAPEAYFQPWPHLIDQASGQLNEYAKDVFRQRDIRPLLQTAWRQKVEFGINNARYVKIRAGRLLSTREDEGKYPAQLDTKHDSATFLQLDNAMSMVVPSASIEQDNSVTTPVSTIQAQSAASPDAQTNDTPDTFFDELEAKLKDPQPIDWLTFEQLEANTEDVYQPNIKRWELDGLFKVYLEYVNQVPYLHVESEFKHHRMRILADGQGQIDVYPFKQRRRIISKQIHYFDHPAFGIVIRLERFEPPPPTVGLDTLLNQ